MKHALKKPLVVFVFCQNAGDKSTKFGGFARRLDKGGASKGFRHDTVALEDLVYIIDNNQQAHILLPDYTEPFEDASLVYFKSWESMPEEAAGLAVYLESQGIPYVDNVVGGMGVGKLPQLFRIWAAGLSVTPFAYGNINDQIVDKYLPAEQYIVKGTKDGKGKDNKLVDLQSLHEYLGYEKMVQPFIDNNGDYRVLTYGFKARGALYRTAQKGSHLNNTSAGATSEYLDIADLDTDVVDMAQKAAHATGHEVAGVDVLPSKSGELYVLEVNQGSQIVTGHSTDKKIEAFGRYLHERLASRYSKKTPKKKIIGRHIRVDIPQLALENVQGKVDTGAYQSALCAHDIYVKDKLLYYSPYISGQKYPECIAKNYDITRVKNTSGDLQIRYRINLEIVILGEKIVTPVTLVDRSMMKSPLLIGRRALRGRFIVNVELSRKAFEHSL